MNDKLNNENDKNNLKEIENSNFIQPNLLSDLQWKMLFTGSIVVQVEEGETLLDENSSSDHIYLLISGIIFFSFFLLLLLFS